MTQPHRISTFTTSVCRLLTIVLLAGIYPHLLEAQAPPVPSNYEALYTQEQNYLDTFNATLSGSGGGAAYPTLYTATLTQADANSGPQLIGSGYMTGIQMEVEAMKAMGMQAVVVQVGFPMLYEPFLTSQGQTQAAYVTFYQQVAQLVRAQGMKLIVENDTLFSNDVQAGWDTAPFYETLDWDSYQAARAADAVTIEQTMQPDYLVVLEEPDTEADNTGQANVNTSSGAAAELSEILAGLQTYRQSGLKVGAGVGTWLAQYQSFIQSFVTEPMDFIDMHIYPVNFSYLPNALSIASMAQAAGMPVAMSECWINKELDADVGTANSDDVRALNTFSFWGPLDVYFLQTMQALANYTQMAFLAPSNTEYFYAYLTYDSSTDTESDADLISQAESAMATANAAGTYSSTGTSWYAMLVTTPDTTPPSAPTNVTGVSGNPNNVYLNWNPSTDDLGVAGYYILRNGTVVGSSAQLLPTTPPPSNTVIFTDTGLAEATPYTYTIEAYDMAGNVSQPSQPITISTADVTPPTPPPSLTVKPASCYSVTLTWSPSTDNGTIGQYLIWWGQSPNAMLQVANTYGTKYSYTYSSLSPSSTYYFGVEAEDSYHNISLMSPVVAVTTPQLPQPPATVTAAPVSTTKATITWTASTGGLAIANYHVYRGTSPSSLAQLFTTTKTTYTDTTLSASTTYYYAIQAVDTGTPPDLSALSAPVAVTTYGPPSAPTNVVAAAQATTRIGVTWNAAASGGLAIGSYRVWRGSTPSNLVQVATTTKLSYTDTTVQPSTEYYYAVQAGDTAGDLSPLSPPVAVTTYGPPSAPANLTANPTSSSKISLTWSPAVSGGLPISSYHVYAGKSPSTLSQLVVTKNTSYTNTSLSPNTTYYYAVQAADTGNDLSPMSPVVAATTYALPSTPTNVTATGVSSSEITVTWTASTGSLPIGHYNVLRGTSPGSLSQIGMTSKTTYNDRSVTEGTTYYYSVQAVDSANDTSPGSTPVSGTPQ